MSRFKKIAIVTGTRAEFGLLHTAMRAVDAHPKLCLQTVVSGAHFVTGSWRDVKQAGFAIDARVRMQRTEETGRAADAAALGRGVSGFTKAFVDLKPDVVVVLGDRIEAFAASSAATVAGIRVAHLHGGDRAEGVADESMRHAITKLAHLHLPATTRSAKRIKRMGEDPSRIHVVGSPAVDGLNQITANPQAAYCIVMHHPVGDASDAEQQTMTAILKASKKHNPIVMAPNLDPGREGIMQAIQNAGSGFELVTHLPRKKFLETLKAASFIIGNSSAGLIEAAVLKTACVNVGPRQNGREKPANVIDTVPSLRAIQQAIKTAISKPLHRMKHPYGDGLTGERVAGLLATLNPSETPVRKQNTY